MSKNIADEFSFSYFSARQADILQKKPFYIVIVGEIPLRSLMFELEVILPCREVITIRNDSELYKLKGLREGIYCDRGASKNILSYLRERVFEEIPIEEAKKLLYVVRETSGLHLIGVNQ